MRVAFLSDIHANFFYLQTVLTQMEKHAIDQIYCLGDLVGYYDQPNEVIDLVREKGIQCIKGNHEKYLLSELKYDKAKENIYRIQIQRASMSRDNMNFLATLPDSMDLVLGNRRFYLTHSLPGDPLTYAYDVEKLDRDFFSKYDFYCYGHTHIPMIKYAYGTCIINPGSVGQPRDYTGQPSCCIVDLENNVNYLLKVAVDNSVYSMQLKTGKVDESLIKILNRTRNENY